MTDHDLLIKIATDVQDVKRLVEGNGQPGLVTRVALLEGETMSRKRAAAGGGLIGAVIAALLAWLSAHLGLKI